MKRLLVAILAVLAMAGVVQAEKLTNSEYIERYQGDDRFLSRLFVQAVNDIIPDRERYLGDLCAKAVSAAARHALTTTIREAYPGSTWMCPGENGTYAKGAEVYTYVDGKIIKAEVEVFGDGLKWQFVPAARNVVAADYRGNYVSFNIDRGVFDARLPLQASASYTALRGKGVSLSHNELIDLLNKAYPGWRDMREKDGAIGDMDYFARLLLLEDETREEVLKSVFTGVDSKTAAKKTAAELRAEAAKLLEQAEAAEGKPTTKKTKKAKKTQGVN